MSKDSLTRSAIANARVTGSAKATASVTHPGLATGESIVAEQISVTREPVPGAEFEVGPYFTTVQQTGADCIDFDVFADGVKIAELVATGAGWIARSKYGHDLTRPNAFQVAWDALVGLRIEDEKAASEPRICGALAGNEIGICACELNEDGTCPAADSDHATAKWARERDEALTEAERQLRKARQAAGKIDALGGERSHADGLRRLRHEVNSLLLDISDGR